MRSYIKVPIKIITPKIPGKQNSIFYAGKNIAEVKINNKTFVLTTAGEYAFGTCEKSPRYHIDSNGKTNGRRPPIISKLSDKKIREIGYNDLASNWGWFGINVWEKDPHGNETCLDYPTDAYSDYDEAMKAFIKYVERTV